MRSIYLFPFLIFLFFFSNQSYSFVPEVDFPKVVVEGIGTEIKIQLQDHQLQTIEVEYNNQSIELEVVNGVAIIQDSYENEELLTLRIGSFYFEKNIHPIPLWWSIFPPLIAIGMALLFKEVLISLLFGIFLVLL